MNDDGISSARYNDLLRIAESREVDGDADGCIRALRAARDDARERGDPDDELFVGKFLAQKLLNAGSLAEATTVARESVRAATELGDQLAADHCAMVAVKAGLLDAATFQQSAARLGELRAALTDTHPLLYRIDVIAAWLNVLMMQPDIAPAVHEAEQLVILCEPHRHESPLHTHGYGTACFHAGQLLLARKDPRALDYIVAARDSYTELDRTGDVATCQALEARARVLAGEITGFEPTSSATGDPTVRALDLAIAAELAYEQGDFDVSLGHWTEAESLGHIAWSPTSAAAAALGIASCHTAVGRWDDARIALERAIERFNSFDGTDGLARCLACSATIHLGRGDAPAARQAFLEAARLFAAAGMVQDSAVARGGAAVAATESGLDPTEAVAELDACASVLESSGQVVHAAELLRHKARILLQIGDRAGAFRAARRAGHIFSSGGFSVGAARAAITEAMALMPTDPDRAESIATAAFAALQDLPNGFEVATYQAEVANALAASGTPDHRRRALALLTSAVAELDRIRYTLRRERDRAEWSTAWRRVIDLAVTLALEVGRPTDVIRLIETGRVQPVPAVARRQPLADPGAGSTPGGLPGVAPLESGPSYRSTPPALTPADLAASFAFVGSASFELSPPVEIVVGSTAGPPPPPGTIRVDFDAARHAVDPTAWWWSIWLTQDATVWSLVDPLGTITAGSSPRRDDLLDGLARAVARPHADDHADADAAPGEVTTDPRDLMTERMTTGPLGTGRPVAGRFAAGSRRRPAQLAADWPHHPDAGTASFFDALGDWLIPPELAARLHDAFESDHAVSLLIATGPELGGVPWGLLGVPGPTGRSTGGPTAHSPRHADRLRLIETALVGLVPSVGFLASLGRTDGGGTPVVMTVCDPTGNLDNARYAPPSTTHLFGESDQPTPGAVVREPATVASVGDALTSVQRGHAGAFIYQGHAVLGASIHTSGLVLADGVLTPQAFFDTSADRRLHCPATAVLLACDSVGAHVGVEWNGMTPALLWAGAGLVVATLWPTLDVYEASTFESELIDVIAESGDAATALRRLQLERLSTWRAAPGPQTMPYLWAGYQITRGVTNGPRS